MLQDDPVLQAPQLENDLQQCEKTFLLWFLLVFLHSKKTQVTEPCNSLGFKKKAQIHAVHPPSICDSLEAIANAEVGSLAEVMQIITNLN